MTATDVDLVTITGWSPILPCDHGQHATHHLPDDPAAWTVAIHCPECEHDAAYLLCESGRLHLYASTVGCKRCGATGRWERFVARAIGRRAVLIEKREDQCEKAAKRLSQGVLDLTGGAA